MRLLDDVLSCVIYNLTNGQPQPAHRQWTHANYLLL